ncbi:hypothetical protein [Mycetocola miduiensis]|uniref:Uncharacterized protein n=1 Tax=Mycetocola miduiensis TaxID=995034 RepID=A0A1I4ZJ18_9MICO|nr:hypothetical protein [Mycetocola miduiensis]SFN49979.1 hypothetical protein SAMN05216219_0836 [Mycetocola miduiensis]
MADPKRLELTLRKPWFGAVLKPTVVFNGRGQPAQWGTGTWRVSADAPTEVSIFLYNRLWRFGNAAITVSGGSPAPLVYSAPVLPIGPGRLAPAPH